MKRFSVALLMFAAFAVASGCASRGYVRKTVTTSSDALSARIETDENNVKEIRDSLDKKITTVETKVAAVDSRVSGVDTKVSELDSKTTQGMNSLKTDVQGVDQRAGQARTTADRAANEVNVLGQKFQNRNMFNITDEKSIQFKFDSAKIDQPYMAALDELAAALSQNPDAFVVLEGRTDSVGDKDYNVRLGERRIEAVRRYLAIDKGVPIYKIQEISFGSEKPIAENKTKDGREKNRAVKMSVMVPKADAVASTND
jgi:outer membrane protein OmpA-like peptidoglycan-associated protein